MEMFVGVDVPRAVKIHPRNIPTGCAGRNGTEGSRIQPLCTEYWPGFTPIDIVSLPLVLVLLASSPSEVSTLGVTDVVLVSRTNVSWKFWTDASTATGVPLLTVLLSGAPAVPDQS